MWTLLRKDWKVILRSRLLLVTLILYPLIIVAIIGYAFSQPNTRVPLAVLNKDVDAQGRPVEGRIANPLDPNDQGITVSTSQLISGVREDGIPGLADFADLRVVGSEAEGRDLLLQGEVQALVVFPQGFVDALTGFTGSAAIRVLVDQSDPVRANVTEVLVRGIVQQLQELYVEQKVKFVVEAIDQSLNPRPGQRLYPGFAGSVQRLRDIESSSNLTEEERLRVNDTIRFLEDVQDVLRDSRGIVDSVAQPVRATTEGERSGHLFIRDLIVPAALGLSIFWTGTLATSSLLVYEREAHAYKRLGITPTSRAAVVGSKVVLTSGIILVQSLFILLTALVAWDTRIDNLGLTLLLILLSTFASIGLGILLGGVSRDVNGTILLAVLVTFPMLFLSGLFYPVSFMPYGAQLLARLFPLTYTVEGLRGSMLRGFTLGDAAVDVVLLFLFGAATTVTGAALSRWAERRA